MLIPDPEELVQHHRPHGQLAAEAGTPGPNGYQLEVACSCGVVFDRWSRRTMLAPSSLALFARWN